MRRKTDSANALDASVDCEQRSAVARSRTWARAHHGGSARGTHGEEQKRVVVASAKGGSYVSMSARYTV
jgi:hypothetical protein